MEQLDNYWFTAWPRQKTLKHPVWCLGVGLHSGKQVKVQLNPASDNTGILFQVMKDNCVLATIPARINNVVNSSLRTVLSHNQHSIDTTEHLLAAISSCGIHNVIVQVWGNEIPIFSGSASEWVFLLECAGVRQQSSTVLSIKIVKDIMVTQGSACCSLHPDVGFHLSYNLNYDHPMIGQQNISMQLDKTTFIKELSQARTFGFIKDLESIRLQGLAQGATLDNTVVFDQLALMNHTPLIWPNEPARHKLVDVVGDLALAGVEIQGRFCGNQSGHALNHRLVKELFSNSDNWVWN